MSKAPRTIQVPGQPDAAAPEHDTEDSGAGDVASELAALRAEVARLKAGAAPALPSVVYEAPTKHGAARLAASEYADMTVAQLMAAIDSGKVRELPHSQSALCRDGYYVSRASIPA